MSASWDGGPERRPARDGAQTFGALLAEARGIVGPRGSAVALVLWRLRQSRPEDAEVRAAVAAVLAIGDARER
ncbi:MAG TPA: hypothetical protein VFC93_08485 [Chloroflexota bacterium]|nr:hypothetical protein [Chloroflexota bacterium]